jgi:hypothetical protein
MPVTINGTTGIAGANGSASTPAVQGEDTNTGVFFPAADTIAFAEGGVEVARFNSGGNLLVGTTSAPSGGSVSTVFARGATTNLQIHSTDGGGAMYGGLTGGGAIFYTYTGAVGSETYSERARIDSSGNLGVGTITPQAKLDVSGSGAQYVRASSSTNASLRGFEFGVSGVGTSYGSLAMNADSGEVRSTAGFSGWGGFQTFYTNGSERARIDSSGNLLVGTTDPGTDLIRFACAGTTRNQLGLVSTDNVSGNNFVVFRRADGVAIGNVSRNGITNAVLYNTTSDYRLKENVTDLVGGLSRVMALRPVSWVWKDCDGQTGEGFIAHEVQAIVPSAVNGEKDAVEDNGDIKPQGMDASYLVATLVKAVQELKAEVDSLKAQLEAAQ